MLKNTFNTYGSIAKIFHWLIFFLIFGMIIFGYSLENISKETQAMAYNLHKLIGLSILCLMLLRIIWALFNPKPLIPLNTRLWERIAERLVHYLLYALVVAMPLVGWVGSSAGGHPPHLGNILIRFPITEDKALAKMFMNLHNSIAILLIILISIHVLAALYHHFIRKDDVLKRMLPFS